MHLTWQHDLTTSSDDNIDPNLDDITNWPQSLMTTQIKPGHRADHNADEHSKDIKMTTQVATRMTTTDDNAIWQPRWQYHRNKPI
jgi:hypothetical protein